MTISNSTSEFPPEDSENPSTFQTNIKLKGKEKQTEQEKRKEKESPINQGVKISQKRNIGYSDMCQFLLNQTITGAMLQFFTDYVGLNNNAIYGTALLIFGFWDAINNTIFAYFSDKATPHPQKGKRKRFIVWGLPIMFLGFTLLVLTPRSWTDMRKFAMILGTMFVFDTGLALFQVNLEALIIT